MLLFIIFILSFIKETSQSIKLEEIHWNWTYFTHNSHHAITYININLFYYCHFGTNICII